MEKSLGYKPEAAIFARSSRSDSPIPSNRFKRLYRAICRLIALAFIRRAGNNYVPGGETRWIGEIDRRDRRRLEAAVSLGGKGRNPAERDETNPRRNANQRADFYRSPIEPVPVAVSKRPLPSPTARWPPRAGKGADSASRSTGSRGIRSFSFFHTAHAPRNYRLRLIPRPRKRLETIQPVSKKRNPLPRMMHRFGKRVRGTIERPVRANYEFLNVQQRIGSR